MNLQLLIFITLTGCVHSGFISLTTSNGFQYMLSDSVSTSFTDASNQCAAQGSTLAVLDNTKYQDVVDYLSANSPTYDNYQIWIDITKTSRPDRYYFSGGEEVTADKWNDGEPNENCGRNCCYRMTLTTYGTTEHKLADHYCSQNYHFICDVTVETTTTTPETTTTTTDTTSTTPETTTTTPETTTTTPETTTTTPETTTTTPETTATTPETTTTTPETTSTFASATTQPITTTSGTSILNTTGIALSPVTATTASAPPSLPLSSGQQMSVLYIGIIVGGSLTISCCCSTMWLAINRTRRRFNAKHLDEESEEKDEENSDDSGVSSDEDIIS